MGQSTFQSSLRTEIQKTTHSSQDFWSPGTNEDREQTLGSLRRRSTHLTFNISLGMHKIHNNVEKTTAEKIKEAFTSISVISEEFERREAISGSLERDLRRFFFVDRATNEHLLPLYLRNLFYERCCRDTSRDGLASRKDFEYAILSITQKTSRKWTSSEMEKVCLYAVSDDRVHYSYDRFVNFLCLPNVARHVLASYIRGLIRQRVKRNSRPSVRVELRSRIARYLKDMRNVRIDPQRDRSETVRNVLVKGFGFRDLDEDMVYIAASTQCGLISRTAESVCNGDLLFHFTMTHVADLLHIYLNDFETHGLRLPSIVSIRMSSSLDEERVLASMLYRCLPIQIAPHTHIWFGREDCASICSERSDRKGKVHTALLGVRVQTKKRHKSKGKIARGDINGILKCTWSDDGDDNRDETSTRIETEILNLAVTRERIRPYDVTMTYVGEMTPGCHLWCSRRHEIQRMDIRAIQQSSNELREDILAYEEERGEKSAFALFDADRSGHILFHEFRSILNIIGSCDGLSEYDVLGVLRRIDLNDDGKIDEEEMGSFLDDQRVNASGPLVFIPMHREERHEDEIVGSFSRASEKRVVEACKQLKIDIYKHALTDHRKVFRNEDVKRDESFYRSTFEIFDFNGNGYVDENEFVSQLEHLGIGQSLSKYEMRCVHAQVCNSNVQDDDDYISAIEGNRITLSSFTKFVNGTSHSMRQNGQSIRLERLFVMDGGTVTPSGNHARAMAKVSSSPGKLELVIESVKLSTSKCATFSSDRVEPYFRTRVQIGREKIGKWKRTPAVTFVSGQDALSWPENTAMCHIIDRFVTTEPIALIVELWDRDGLSESDDVRMGRGKFYVNLATISPSGTLLLELELHPDPPTMITLGEGRRNSLSSRLRATLRWNERKSAMYDIAGNHTEPEHIRVHVGGADGLSPKLSGRAVWLECRLTGNGTRDVDTTTKTPAVSVGGDTLAWPHLFSPSMTCNAHHTFIVFELWTARVGETYQSRPVLAALARVSLEPFRRTKFDQGPLSVYKIDRVKLSDKHGRRTRGFLRGVSISSRCIESEANTPVLFKSVVHKSITDITSGLGCQSYACHIGHISCVLSRVMSSRNFSGSLVSVSMSVPGNSHFVHIPSITRVGAPSRCVKSIHDADMRSFDVVLFRARDCGGKDSCNGDGDHDVFIDNVIVPALSINLLDMNRHRPHHDSDNRSEGQEPCVLARGSVRFDEVFREPGTFTKIKAALSCVHDEKGTDKIYVEIGMTFSIRQKPIYSPSPPPPKVEERDERTTSTDTILKELTLSSTTTISNAKSAPTPDVTKNAKDILNTLLDAVLRHEIIGSPAMISKRLSKLEIEICDNGGGGGYLPRPIFRRFLEDVRLEMKVLTNAEWILILNLLSDIDDSRRKSFASVNYEKFLRLLRKRRKEVRTSMGNTGNFRRTEHPHRDIAASVSSPKMHSGIDTLSKTWSHLHALSMSRDLSLESQNAFTSPFSKTISQDDTRWKCPVCFYRQVEQNCSRCAMCGSRNPYTSTNEVQWMCLVCTFSNPEGSNLCGMCGATFHVPLKSSTHPRSSNHGNGVSFSRRTKLSNPTHSTHATGDENRGLGLIQGASSTRSNGKSLVEID